MKHSHTETNTSLKTFLAGFIFIGLLLLYVGSTYYKFFVVQDYIVLTTINCDPSRNSCFKNVCEPDDGACDESFYLYISKNAKTIPVCDPYADEDCEELYCEQGEVGCEIIECSSGTVSEGEVCATDIDRVIETLDN